MSTRQKPQTLNGQWLTKTRATNNPTGDIIADMKCDYDENPNNFPEVFHDISEMRAYFHSRGACEAVVDLIPNLWVRYRQWMIQNVSTSEWEQLK